MLRIRALARCEASPRGAQFLRSILPLYRGIWHAAACYWNSDVEWRMMRKAS